MNLDEARAILSRRDQWETLSTYSYSSHMTCQFKDLSLAHDDRHTCFENATWARRGTDRHYLDAFYIVQDHVRVVIYYVCDEHARLIWGEEVKYPEIEALHELQHTLESLQ